MYVDAPWCEFLTSFIYFLTWVLSYQCSDKLGLSLELGSFAAGVMISTTDLAQHTLEQARFLDYMILLLCLKMSSKLLSSIKLCWLIFKWCMTDNFFSASVLDLFWEYFMFRILLYIWYAYFADWAYTKLLCCSFSRKHWDADSCSFSLESCWYLAGSCHISDYHKNYRGCYSSQSIWLQ